MTVKLTLHMRPKALLKRERGVWVYRGKPTEASVAAVID
jgi:hypothetical protein